MTLAIPYNPQPIRVLTGQERAAAIILTMNPETTRRVMKHFDPDQIKTLMKVASGLGQISHVQITDLVDEFVHNFSNGSDIVGNPSEIQKLLAGILPKDQIDGIMDEVNGNANRSIWERISSVSEGPIAAYLLKEHPQTAALILSKINPRTTAKVLSQLPTDLRGSVTNRMLSLKPIIDETSKSLEAALQENFVTNFSRDASSDTHSRMAKIMNGMERDHMEAMLTDIGTTRPKSVEILKSMLFTFEDVIRLTARDRSLLLEQVGINVVAIALMGADGVVRETILTALSTRTRRIVENEMEMAQGLTPKDVSDARRTVTEMALELASRNEITMPVGADHETGFY